MSAEDHAATRDPILDEILLRLTSLEEKLDATLSTVDSVVGEIKPTIDQLASGPVGKMLGIKKDKEITPDGSPVPKQRSGRFF